MKRSSEFDQFCQAIAQEGLTEPQKAVALLWYADHFSPGAELSPAELAKQLHVSRLTGPVNVGRLRKNLSKTGYTVRGKSRDTFGIGLKHKQALNDRYLPLLKTPVVEVSDQVLPHNVVEGTRPYLECLALQVNGCYQFHFYDACAVLCRRMVESLLIQAFDNVAHLATIQDGDGNIKGLDFILKQARSGRFLKLGKTTAGNLDKVKEIGDTAAHDRYHKTTEQDIAEFRSGFRKVVSELMALAGIKPSA